MQTLSHLEIRTYEFLYTIADKNFSGISGQADFLIDGEPLGRTPQLDRPWFGRTRSRTTNKASIVLSRLRWWCLASMPTLALPLVDPAGSTRRTGLQAGGRMVRKGRGRSYEDIGKLNDMPNNKDHTAVTQMLHGPCMWLINACEMYVEKVLNSVPCVRPWPAFVGAFALSKPGMWLYRIKSPILA